MKRNPGMMDNIGLHTSKKFLSKLVRFFFIKRCTLLTELRTLVLSLRASTYWNDKPLTQR